MDPVYDLEYGREGKDDLELENYLDKNMTDKRREEFAIEVMRRRRWEWEDLNEDAFIDWLTEEFRSLE